MRKGIPKNIENQDPKKNKLFDDKRFRNRAKIPPEIYEKTLQTTMPKAHRPRIKHIITNEVPEPQTTLFFPKEKHNICKFNQTRTSSKQLEKKNNTQNKSSEMGAKRPPKINQKPKQK